MVPANATLRPLRTFKAAEPETMEELLAPMREIIEGMSKEQP